MGAPVQRLNVRDLVTPASDPKPPKPLKIQLQFAFCGALGIFLLWLLVARITYPIFTHYLIPVLIALAAAGCVGSLFYKNLRWLAGAILLGTFYGAIIGGFLAADWQADADARSAGYESASERDRARQLGITTGAAYADFKRTELVREKIDAEEAAARKIAEQKNKEAQCRQNVTCFADKFTVDAWTRCQMIIQSVAKYDYEWTNGWSTKFPSVSWKDKAHGIVSYHGDSLKLQNGFGAWIPHRYRCDYDTTLGMVVDFDIQAGRIP